MLGTYVAQNAIDVSVSGTIAYLATGGVGLKVIDVSNPTLPVLLSTYAATNIRRVSTFKTTAAITESDGTIHMIDVDNPSGPTLIGLSTSFGSLALDIDIKENIVYGAISSIGVGLLIIDFNNPKLPILLSVAVKQQIIGGNINFFRSGSIGYITDSAGFQIIDLSSSTNLIFLGQYILKNSAGFDISVSENIAYLAAGPAGLDRKSVV